MYEAYGAIELMVRVFKPGIAHVQTVALMRHYEQTKGNYASGWMLWGNAVK
jgi:hypothetical protein